MLSLPLSLFFLLNPAPPLSPSSSTGTTPTTVHDAYAALMQSSATPAGMSCSNHSAALRPVPVWLVPGPRPPSPRRSAPCLLLLFLLPRSHPHDPLILAVQATAAAMSVDTAKTLPILVRPALPPTPIPCPQSSPALDVPLRLHSCTCRAPALQAILLPWLDIFPLPSLSPSPYYTHYHHLPTYTTHTHRSHAKCVHPSIHPLHSPCPHFCSPTHRPLLAKPPACNHTHGPSQSRAGEAGMSFDPQLTQPIRRQLLLSLQTIDR